MGRTCRFDRVVRCRSQPTDRLGAGWRNASTSGPTSAPNPGQRRRLWAAAAWLDRERMSRTTARRWLGRFVAHRCDGFKDRPRSGRPLASKPTPRALIVALACEPPADRNVRLNRYSLSELSVEVANPRHPGGHARAHQHLAAVGARCPPSLALSLLDLSA